ncbi:MAG: flagellar type III secretion system pore protein FliP, partial [Sphingomonadales bacterium]
MTRLLSNRLALGGLVVAAVLAAGLLLAPPAMAQQLNLDLGEDGTLSGRVVQILLLLTVLSLAPSILIVLTSFTRIIIVLSLLRSALGTQQTPPNMVLVSLALFLTGFIMAPTFQAAYETGVAPLMAEEIEPEEAFDRVTGPFRTFMLAQVRDTDLQLFFDMSREEPPETPDLTPLQVLVPAFMISELRRAFEIGFLLFVPFVVIDLVVASILMSM